jgi:RNA recognition motif-containing protein
MIKNKSTGTNKDFAFVEFFTAEETANAFKIGNEPGFKISGEPVTVLYSKNRKDERDMNSMNLNPNRSDDFGYGLPTRRRREPR